MCLYNLWNLYLWTSGHICNLYWSEQETSDILKGYTNLKYLTSSLALSTLYIKAAPSSQQHGEYWRWAKLTTASRPRRHHGLLLLLLLQVGKQQEGASAAVALHVLLHLDVYYYIDIDDDVVGSSSSRREGELYTYLLISQGATEYSLGRNGGDRL